MKLDIETIIVLRTTMSSLAKGIDPTSNIAFPKDTILNSKILQSCFADSADIFKYLQENIEEINRLSLRKKTNQKSPFYMSEEDYKKIPIYSDPISISKFVHSINEVCKKPDMKKLRATQITQLLTSHGYLELSVCKDNSECKIATKHGEKIGITSIGKINSRGDKYYLNLYDSNAQRFILDSILPQIAVSDPMRYRLQ